MGKKGQVAWNKGLTKQTHPAMARLSGTIRAQMTPEERASRGAKISVSLSKYFSFPAAREAQSSRIKSFFLRHPEAGSRHSQAMKSKYDDLGFRRLHTERVARNPKRIQAMRTLGYREKVSGTSRKRWANPEYKKLVTASVAKSMCQHPNTLERWMSQVLVSVGAEFLFCAPVCGYIPDFLLPSLRLIIECDGTYWHSPAKVGDKDRLKDSVFSQSGYTVLRVPEELIRNHSGEAELLVARTVWRTEILKQVEGLRS